VADPMITRYRFPLMTQLFTDVRFAEKALPGIRKKG
jgi:hypothetical protein